MKESRNYENGKEKNQVQTNLSDNDAGIWVSCRRSVEWKKNVALAESPISWVEDESIGF
jgi:hypothetical protein